MDSFLMFLNCPAYMDKDGASRCGLPAEVHCRYTMNSTDGPLESAKISCPRGHHFNGPIDCLAVPEQSAATAGVDGLGRDTFVGLDGVLDEFFRESAVLGGPGFPVNDFPGVNIDDDVKKVHIPRAGSFSLVMSQDHTWSVVGNELAFFFADESLGAVVADWPRSRSSGTCWPPSTGRRRGPARSRTPGGKLVSEFRRAQHRENAHAFSSTISGWGDGLQRGPSPAVLHR